ncbi:3-oxoacyl-ACP reductase [Salinisphaera sp. PC39]|uniref:SDR family NAD(P)-dependent oxidoreductase n=1 Tax=Salinisphaera sp. PC39 TaxID=1304156 RepID=UPI0033423705
MGRLQDKVAIVTGAGTGIGRACMELFAQEGAKVVGVSRTKANLEKVLAEVEKNGGEGMIVPADVSDPDQVQKVVDETVKAYGRVDVVLNGAGVGYSWDQKSPGSMGSVTETEPDKWREVMAIDLDSIYLMSRAAIPHMQKQGNGSIINISSILGVKGNPDAHAYTAAKGALVNLTRSLCSAYALDGIRANCVCPGFIDTPMIQDHISLFDDEATADRLCPMRRAGTPMEMAYGCLYLASDEASYTNGAIFMLDGGTTARI